MRKKQLKRGGDRQRVSLDDVDLAIDAPSDDIVALDEALARLDKEKPTMVKAIELQYFVGLTLGQISEILGVSERTVSSSLAYARAWLYRDTAKRDAKP